MLIGELTPDRGSVRQGSNLEVVTLDQHREALDPDTTLAAALTGGRGDSVTINGQPRHVASYMKDFLFLPEQVRSPLKVLSGGERARLMLARAFAKPSNLLVLDEPTNDLDLETLDLLQELIADYGGTSLIVSHDRDFLDRTVSSVIAYEGAGRWVEYAGGYSDMLAQRGSPARTDTQTPDGSPALQHRSKSVPAAANAKPRRKLSFKERHALETLPLRIAELEGEVAKLSSTLADPGLYASDPAKFQTTTARIASAQAEMAKAEEDWLQLEMRREEVEG